MSKPVARGTILYGPNFRMPDGAIRDKILIVLGTKKGDRYVCAFVTSQRRERRAVRGCHRHPAYFHIPAAEDDFFIKDTWVILSQPLTPRKITVSRRIANGKYRIRGKLNPRLTREIVECQRRFKGLFAWQRRLLT